MQLRQHNTLFNFKNTKTKKHVGSEMGLVGKALAAKMNSVPATPMMEEKINS